MVGRSETLSGRDWLWARMYVPKAEKVHLRALLSIEAVLREAGLPWQRKLPTPLHGSRSFLSLGLFGLSLQQGTAGYCTRVYCRWMSGLQRRRDARNHDAPGLNMRRRCPSIAR